MSEENQDRPPVPEIIPPRNGITELAQLVNGALSSITNRVPFGTVCRNTEYVDLKPEEKQIVDEVMEQLKPDIEEKAKALLTAEIRDRIVRYGNLSELKAKLKKGKKFFVKRKKGCIFIQFGTGDPEDPIEEFLVAST